MPSSDTLSLAALIIAPACLVSFLLSALLWYRQIKRNLALSSSSQTAPSHVLPLHHTSNLAFPTSKRTQRGEQRSREGAGAGAGAVGTQFSHSHHSHRTSIVTLSTNLTPSGQRVLARRSRAVSVPLSTVPPSARASQGSAALSAAVSADANDVATTTIELVRRRSGVELQRRDWSAEFDEGERTEGGRQGGGSEERTEELTLPALSTEGGVDGEPPGSAQWMQGTFSPDEPDPRRRTRTFSSSSNAVLLATSPASPAVDPVDEFIALLRPSPPPQAYLAHRHHHSRSHLQASSSANLSSNDQDGSLSRQRSGTSETTAGGTGSSSGHHHQQRERERKSSAPVPPLPALPSNMYRQSFSSLHPPLSPPAPSQNSHHSLPAQYIARSPTRTVRPTLLESALLRSASSPILRNQRPPPQRQRTDPLPIFPPPSDPSNHRSSADLYLYSSAFSLPSPTSSRSPLSPHVPLPTSSTSPLPSQPPSPLSPRSPTSPPLTDFPTPSVPRPPRGARPKVLPSSSFGGSATAGAQTNGSGKQNGGGGGIASRWSFRHRTSNSSFSPSQSPSNSPEYGTSAAPVGGGGSGLRWSGSWSSRAATRAERQRRVSKELLAPLSVSVRASPPRGARDRQKETEEVLGVDGGERGVEKDEEKGDGWERGRSGSVGTLDSAAQARVNGGGVGGLKLTNPDPSSGRPSTSRDSIGVGAGGSSSGRSATGRASLRLSIETVTAGWR